MIRQYRWLAWSILGLYVATLSGCGVPSRVSPPKPSARVVQVSFPVHSLTALPLYVAKQKGFLGHFGLSLASGPGDIQVTEPDSWPVSAILAIRPDWILISPEPDRHFRWRDLKSFPVSIAGLGPLGPAVMLATLKEHGVPTVQWNVLSLARAQKLFLAHRLPLLLLPLLPAEELVSSGSAHIVQYVAASTGPMPIWVIKGLKEENRTFLAAINQGLTYIRTHSANQIADLVRPDYPGVPPVALKAAIAEMQGLGVLPLSTYLDPNTYQAGADFLVNADVHWPDYSSAVDWHQARDALALAP